MALKDLLTEQDFLSAYIQQYPLHEEFKYGAGPVIASNLKGDPGSGVENFKTTPFGKDQPKGGNSRQPYITTAIPEGTENYAFKSIANFGGTEVGLESGGSGTLETINSISSGLIRGGVISAGIHSVTDVLRLSQFGIDLERGIPFIAKQIGLQRSNVKLEAPSKSAPLLNNNRTYNLGVNTIAQAGVNAFGLHFKRHGLFPSPSDGQDDNTGYYKLATRNNLANDNRLVNLGEKTGLVSPNSLSYSQTLNLRKAALTPLNVLKSLNIIDGEVSNEINETPEKLPTPERLEGNVLYEYSGGPKSLYGIGGTTHFRTTDTLAYRDTVEGALNTVGIKSHTPTARGRLLDLNTPVNPDKPGFNYYPISYTFNELTKLSGEDKIKIIDGVGTTIDPALPLYTTKTEDSKILSGGGESSVSNLYNYLSLDQPTSQKSKVGTNGNDFNKVAPSIGGNAQSPSSSFYGQESYISLNNLQDFRKTKAEKANGDPNLKTYYQKISSEYGAKKGKKGVENGNMEARLGIGTGFDKMGELPIITTSDDINSETKFNTRDLIKFFIEAVDNDDPQQKDYIQFRALLDSFNDGYRAKWKNYHFVGNPETFYNYDSFDRDISLSFKILAFRREELRPLYIRLNALISQLFPDYSSDNTRARAPYVKLTVGSYLDRQPGFIESLRVKWNKDYSWEIGIEKSTGEIENTGEIQVVPHILDIDMKFTPIHTFVPRKVKSTDSDVPFITLNSRNKNDSKRVWIGKADNYKKR